MNMQEKAMANIIVKHLAGSHAYGTNIETSDVDYRGIFIADDLTILSPFYNVEQVTDQTEEDTVYYELSKFVKLLVDQNPNIVESLWVDESDVLFKNQFYDFLRSNRDRLLSSKCAFTYSGYAISQLKRLKGHNKWINNPQPVEPPQQYKFLSLIRNYTPMKMFKFDAEAFNVGRRLVPYGNDIYGVYGHSGYSIYNVDSGNINTIVEDGSEYENIHPDFIVKYNKDEYKVAKEKHKQYWDWKKNRNKTRSELEEHFGYDTKHAMHLVRLLRMAKEILTEGVVHVKRPDAKELLAIRNGKWNYDELIEWSENMDNDIRTKYYPQTDLQKSVDLSWASELVRDIYFDYWGVDYY